MSMEENKKLVRRYCEEVFDQGKVDLIDEFVAPDPSYGPDYLENHTGADVRGRWVARGGSG
jgi:hypothetical protein